MDPNGTHIGFMAEEESGIAKIVMRQWLRTHRSFTTHIFDKHGIEVLKFHRPFSFINSRIGVYDPIDPNSYTAPALLSQDQYRVIGEVHQQWHLLRRKYNLFLHDNDLEHATEGMEKRKGSFRQWAYVDEPFLSWDFSLLTEKQELVGSINRNFAGFAREIFTDTGVYALRMDAASTAAEPSHLISKTQQGKTYRPDEQYLSETGQRGMTLDERAIMLAAAVTVDFDYFSRHSGHGGLMPPFGIFGFGGTHNPSTPAQTPVPVAGGVGSDVGRGVVGADVAAGAAMGGVMGSRMGGDGGGGDNVVPPSPNQGESSWNPPTDEGASPWASEPPQGSDEDQWPWGGPPASGGTSGGDAGGEGGDFDWF